MSLQRKKNINVNRTDFLKTLNMFDLNSKKKKKKLKICLPYYDKFSHFACKDFAMN